MSALRLAAASVGHVVLRAYRFAGAAVRGVWRGMEYVLDAWTMSGVQPSMALDLVPSMRGLVVARGLV
jgi:hypothetical protein